jgi:hypothetical protein
MIEEAKQKLEVERKEQYIERIKNKLRDIEEDIEHIIQLKREIETLEKDCADGQNIFNDENGVLSASNLSASNIRWAVHNLTTSR